MRHDQCSPRRPARAPRCFAVAISGLLLLLTACPTTNGPQSRQTGRAAPRPPVQAPTEARGKQLVVWADPVLLSPLEGLAREFRTASKGGSYQLVSTERAQLLAWAESGSSDESPAPDLLLFAGRDDYLSLLENQRIDESSARTFAGDRLMLVKPLKTSFVCPNLFDIYRSRFSELVVGDPEATLLGLLTDQALISDGAKVRIIDRLRLETDSLVPATAPKDSDNILAIVFASQVGRSIGIEPMLLIDSGLHEPLQYKAVAAAGKGSDPAVVAFLRWLAEDSITQLMLGGYGLLDRKTALAAQQPVGAGGAPLPPDASISAPPAEGQEQEGQQGADGTDSGS